MILILIFSTLMATMPASGQTVPSCKTVLTLREQSFGGALSLSEIKLCSKTSTGVMLQVRSASQPLRSIFLSTHTYREYLAGAQNSAKDSSPAREVARACRHRSVVKIEWEGLKTAYSTCAGTSHSSVVSKLSALVRDLYDEP